MPFDETGLTILKYIEAGNTAEAFSLLMSYAYNNQADDMIIDRVLKLVAETDLISDDTDLLKSKTVRLLKDISESTRNDDIADDPNIIKLSRVNYFNQTESPVFSCEGLYKKLGFFELKNISINLQVGEITAVVGENGNGKTTLCRIVAGLISKDKGMLCYPYFEQTNTEKLDWNIIKSNIAYLAQDVPSLSGTVKNTLHLECSLHGIKKAENIQRVDFIIRRLGLTNYAETEWNQLSGGYKLRFALARILLWRPRLIILDEPLANLDLKAQITVLSDLRDFANSISYPLSILVTSQHIHEVEYVADKIIFLKNGETVYYDSVDAIGKNRKCNNYEISCDTAPGKLEQALRHLEVNSIEFNGLYFELETPVQVASKDILKAMNDADIELSLFRDISNSTKKFLQTNG